MTLRDVKWLLALLAVALGVAAALTRSPIDPSRTAAARPTVVKPPSGC